MKERGTKCPQCGKTMLFKDTVCPFCGKPIKRTKSKQALIWIPLIVLVGSFALKYLDYAVFVYREFHVSKAEATQQESATEKDEPWYEQLRPLAFWLPQHVDLDPDGEDMERAHTTLFNYIQYTPASRQDLVEHLTYLDYLEEDAKVIVSYFETDYKKQALRFVEERLEAGGYSHQDLMESLEYRGFLPEEIAYAMENIDPDWREQAEICAADYLDAICFSYEGLIDQLEYHGFSHEDALYAADHCGADWKENAVTAAKEQMEFDRSTDMVDLVAILEEEGFTLEEIEYALSVVQ